MSLRATHSSLFKVHRAAPKAQNAQSVRNMTEYLQTAFSGPPLIASCLLVLVSLYWLMVIVGMADFDGLDFDLDLDVDLDPDAVTSALSLGAAPLRWLNVGRIPFMLWVSAFVLVFWLTSMLWDTPSGRESGWNLAAAVVRNLAIGLLGAKVLTQPLCGLLSDPGMGAVTTADLIGRTCRPTTAVTADRGQAKVEVPDGAPLLLSVRAESENLDKGQLAQIVDYDRTREVYIVRPAPEVTPDEV